MKVETYKSFNISASDIGGFTFWHENYDGAPDATEPTASMAGHCPTIAICKEAIDDLIAEYPEIGAE